MNVSHLATMLSAIAFAVAVPAWAVPPAGQANSNGTTVSDQASTKSEAVNSTQSDVKDTTEGNVKRQSNTKHQSNAKQQPHGPTAIMDRATPTEKSDEADATAKHPPTARMDRSTPNQKSPSTKSESDTQEQGMAK